MSTYLPLVPGPWLAMTDDESSRFLERLARVLAVGGDSAVFPGRMPIHGLRCIPLSFYPGWLLVEGQAQCSDVETGYFNVLYGPSFMWVIDGRSEVIHQINAGRIPNVSHLGASAAKFLPAALAPLEAKTTGPDYLRFFCSAVWGEDGPFWLIENKHSPLLVRTESSDVEWHGKVKPLEMEATPAGLRAEAVVAYGSSVFLATFVLDGGQVLMESDTPLGDDHVVQQRYRSPFRNLQTHSATAEEYQK